MEKYALISVYEKSGIIDFARFIKSKGYGIISTGGTFDYLTKNGIDAIQISEITDFPEIFEGRVKTLHPKIMGGILYRRENKKDIAIKDKLQIPTIDVVIVNLYPFFQKVQEGVTGDELIEFIDIGGPSMIRAAAKNFKDILVVTDPDDYISICQEWHNGGVCINTKQLQAAKVFNLMSAYDAAVSNALVSSLPNEIMTPYMPYLSISMKKKQDLRYGENPHQSAAFYSSTTSQGTMTDFKKINGKEISYNNIKDMDSAWKVVSEFDEPCCCAVKHNNPCGAALGSTILEAYQKAYECDTMSIFGGIVACNKAVDSATAAKISEIFLDIVIASEFTKEALSILKKKKNLRIVQINIKPSDSSEYISVDGGVLVQSRDNKLYETCDVKTIKKPTDQEMEEMLFGLKVVKHIKSNAIVVVNNKATVGIGVGQVNRVWAAEDALKRGKGAKVLVSDGFFPFDDVVTLAADAGISAIMQPGGSLKDEDSINACNKYGISLVFTGIRHFKH